MKERGLGMKKRKTQMKNNIDKSPTLKDSLNDDLLSKLQETKKTLVDQEQKRIDTEKQKKEEARKLREKNKSFEELFEESSMNWQDYKK